MDYRKFAFRMATDIRTTSNVLFVSSKSSIFRLKKEKKKMLFFLYYLSEYN